MAETRTAVITGASGGIGYELARLFAQDGYRLALVARSGEKLAEIAAAFTREHGVDAIPIPLDLADPAAPGKLDEELRQRGLPVHALVNNAGFGSYGPFVEAKLDTELAELQVNIVALTELTRRCLPQMVARGQGYIMNVASTAAFQPGPYMAVYYATKAYVLSFSEAIAEELRDTGVTVTTLCPGPTKTEFQQRAGMEASGLMRFRAMEAADVARRGYRGMLAGKRVVITGLSNRLLQLSAKFAPRNLVVKTVRMVQEETQNR